MSNPSDFELNNSKYANFLPSQLILDRVFTEEDQNQMSRGKPIFQGIITGEEDLYISVWNQPIGYLWLRVS